MKINYHNKKFRVYENTQNGETSPELIFEYKQKGNILTCDYNDLNIISGHLIGLVDNIGNIDISYHQVNIKGELKTGKCFSKPEIMKDGKIKIHESWEWTSGNKTKGKSTLIEI